MRIKAIVEAKPAPASTALKPAPKWLMRFAVDLGDAGDVRVYGFRLMPNGTVLPPAFRAPQGGWLATVNFQAEDDWNELVCLAVEKADEMGLIEQAQIEEAAEPVLEVLAEGRSARRIPLDDPVMRKWARAGQ